jgi:hypothetical protein
MRLVRIFYLWLFFMLASSAALFATHLRAGEITVLRKECGLKVVIIITVYTNTIGTDVRYDGGELNFGDGTKSIRPRIENRFFGVGIGIVTDTINHTFPGADRYTITYREPNRNAGILNMASSVDTPFFLETFIVIDPPIGCDNSPVLEVPPIDRGCKGVSWSHNPGARDEDRDSLSYEFTIPKQARGVFVTNYLDPNNENFYNGIDYSKANEDQNGPPTFKIDNKTGTITWDAPGAIGEYNIAFRVYQWRKISTVWEQIGYVTRDMQIIIEDCLNQRPLIVVPQLTCVVAGTIPPINEMIVATDPDNDQVKIEAFSEVFNLSPSPATYSPKPPVFSASPAQLTFNWATKCEHVKDQFYQVVFKVSDKPPVGNGPTLTSFGVWPIRVMGPKPVLNPLVPNLTARSIAVSWQPYQCTVSATSMEIWRRVDSFAGTQAQCDTGMPSSFGYTKIQTVPINSTAYTDVGLAAGATYCYRLVAVFPRNGGLSKVSDEQCMQQEFLIDRPVITKVSIDKTSPISTTSSGKIEVNWVAPLDLTPQQFGYEVWRAEGFSGNIGLTKVSPGNTITATSYQDEGMDTQDKIYNYFVQAFDATGIKLDASTPASTVRLEITSKFEELELRWVANVPWSNSITNQTHSVFRSLKAKMIYSL